MQNNRHGRFRGASWYDNAKPLDISIIGLGGIGSWLSLLLSRIGDHHFYLYDFDKIEEHNLGGQLFAIRDIENYKDLKAQENMIIYSGSKHTNTFGRFTEDSMVTPYMFTPLDNMTVRKLAFDKWAESYGDIDEALFVDLRMSVESCELYFVTKDRLEDYKATLFEDGDIPEQPCSFKATSHCGALCASMGVAGFTNFLANLYTDTDFRELPFKVRVDLPTMKFNLINEYATSSNLK